VVETDRSAGFSVPVVVFSGCSRSLLWPLKSVCLVEEVMVVETLLWSCVDGSAAESFLVRDGDGLD
jgi:hypothetical protein